MRSLVWSTTSSALLLRCLRFDFPKVDIEACWQSFVITADSDLIIAVFLMACLAPDKNRDQLISDGLRDSLFEKRTVNWFGLSR
jgi:hypothetical protein